jgi:hypothetical protein
MVSAEHLFVLSIAIFLSYAIFVSIEKGRGKRLLFSGLRNLLDIAIVKTVSFFSYWFNYMARHIIKLSWYYSIHRFLQLIMTLLVKTYDRLEVVFMQNRAKARIIKIEKKKLKKDNHLHQVANHKEAVSLTEEEKKILLAKKLERE